MDWLKDVRECVATLPREFSLHDLDRFIPYLHGRHPANNHVEAKVRQMLQRLRDEGEVVFLGQGLYRKVESGPAWNLEPGAITTRADLAKKLGMEGAAPLGRGMFKRREGPFSKDLLLFHHVHSNPYGDRLDSDRRIIYVGEGQHGDQELVGNNRHLAQHLEEGIRVHFFVKKDSSPALHYQGQVALEEVQRVYRDEEERSVLEFSLHPVQEGDLAFFGQAYQNVLGGSLEPHVVPRKTTVRVVEQKLRDRAFSIHLRRQYGDECAVCGPPLVHEQHVDAQGAHVRSVAAGGPDVLNNGVCLCARHHWAFDHGIFTLDDSWCVRLRAGFQDPHNELEAGLPVAKPRDGPTVPHPTYLAWHRRNWRFS